MEQPAANEFAQHGDQIEITEPGRVDFGKRFQVESSGPLKVMVLDNRIRVFVLHTDYRVVKRCGKPATDQVKKKVGRPSNAELAARAVEASKEATKDVPASPRLNDKYSVAVDDNGIVKGIVTKEELAALEKAIDVPVTRKPVVMQGQRAGKTAAATKQIKQAIADGKTVVSPFAEQVKASHSFPASSELAKRSPLAELEGVKAQIGDIIKITGGSHLIDPNSKYVAGTELRVHASAEEVIARGLNNYAPLVWNFIVKHGDYEIVATASQEKALADVPVDAAALLPSVELTQEQFDAMTKQDNTDEPAPAGVGDLIELTADVANRYRPGEWLEVTASHRTCVDATGPEAHHRTITLDHNEYRIVKRKLDMEATMAMAAEFARLPEEVRSEYAKRIMAQAGYPPEPKYSHYFKPCPFSHVDIYRVLSLFAVTDPCLQHAIKKLLVAGGRGHKDIQKDVQESIDTLARWQAMRAEEQAA